MGKGKRKGIGLSETVSKTLRPDHVESLKGLLLFDYRFKPALLWGHWENFLGRNDSRPDPSSRYEQLNGGVDRRV